MPAATFTPYSNRNRVQTSALDPVACSTVLFGVTLALSLSRAAAVSKSAIAPEFGNALPMKMM